MPEPRSRLGAKQPGDEVIIIERRKPVSMDDYDWYDKDGVRVRVREI